MQEILKNSFIYRFLAAIYGWFSRQWCNSRIISRFLNPKWGENGETTGILATIVRWLRNLLCTVFEKLRLTRLFANSIFKQSWFWCALPVILAPIVPTMLVIAMSAVGCISLAIDFGSDRSRRMMPARTNAYVLLYAAVYFISIFTSVNVSGSMQGGLLTVFFLLFSVIFQGSIRSRKQLDTLLCLMVLAGVLVAFYGIYQYVFGLTGSEKWLDSDMFSGISLRVYSTLENPNVLAEYLLLIIPFAAAFLLTSRGAGKKLLFLACLGLMLICIVLTFSRGGWLGLIFAAAVFLVLWDRRFILVGIIALVALYFLLPDMVISRFTSIGDLGDTSTSYRVYIWAATLAMLKKYWLCGVGPGTAAYTQVYLGYSFSSITAPHAHNLYLQIICDSGVCGILVFLIILFQYFRSTCSALSHNKDKRTKMFLIAAVSGVTGFLVQSMTDYSFYNYRVMFLFWIIIAIGVLCAKRMALPEKENLWLK